jgi:membrane protease YdiL (CAAX protease family)
VIDEAPPVLEQRPSPPVVWFIVWGILIMLAGLQVAALFVPEEEPGERGRLMREVARFEQRYTDAATTADGRGVLADAANAIGKMRFDSKGVAGSAARIEAILRQESNPSGVPDFSRLNDDVDDLEGADLQREARDKRRELNQAIRDVYTSARLEPARAKEVRATVARVSGDRWPYPLMAERAKKLAGWTDEFEPTNVLLGMLVAAAFLAGLTAWIVYAVMRARGKLAPAGMPLENAGPDASDSLGVRFLGFLAIFALLPSVVTIGLQRVLPENAASAVSLLAVGVASIPLLFIRAWGVKLTPRAVGLSLDGFWRNAGWGVAGWVANVPVVATLLILSQLLLRSLPGGEHPIQQEVFEPGGAWTALFGAALFAPIFEEIFFRGCFYQGLQARVAGRALPIVLTSLAFASLHPQGISAWLVLGWIGAMGCLLFRQTGSLVAPIVMHSLNNLGAVALLLLIG